MLKWRTSGGGDCSRLGRPLGWIGANARDRQVRDGRLWADRMRRTRRDGRWKRAKRDCGCGSGSVRFCYWAVAAGVWVLQVRSPPHPVPVPVRGVGFWLFPLASAVVPGLTRIVACSFKVTARLPSRSERHRFCAIVRSTSQRIVGRYYCRYTGR